MKSIICALGILLHCAFAWAYEGPRYVSLAPATTEILFSLGLDNEIVGVSSYCNYPATARTKERIGSFSQPNIEKILSLKPDIVFLTGLEQNPAVHELRRLGVRVVISDPATFDELLSSIREIGSLTGKQGDAEALVASMQATLEEVRRALNRVVAEKRVKVFIELWHEPLMTAGKGSIVDEALTLAGGVNIASDTSRPYSIFSPEAVIKRNPDCILFTYMDGSTPDTRMKRRAGWDSIAAVRAGRLINDIDPDIILRPSPRLAAGIRQLHHKLYPDE